MNIIRLSVRLTVLTAFMSACFYSNDTPDPLPDNASSVIESASIPPPSPVPTPRPLTEKDISRRDYIHKRMLAGEYLHDGSGELLYIGDITSVPSLLVVLKKHPPDSNGMMVCTTAHALQALQTITGANPGKTYEAWRNWWEQYQKENQINSLK